MMQDQHAAAEAFHALHKRGDPLILYNIWDAGSAAAVARAGAKALATGSWSVAAAAGLADGEQLPLEAAIANLERIVAAVSLPVTIDLEAGYGDPARAVSLAVAAGAIGCNLEDGIIAGGHFPIAEQCDRLAAARAAADATGIRFFLNARVDLFLDANPAEHGEPLLEATLERAHAYAAAGADGLFVPGLADEALIDRLCRSLDKPVNIMASPHAPPAARLAGLGVARISHGPGPYRLAMKSLEEAARAALA
jgi:2-methylisocitrate lyase-like PEP mutase family enzyme